MTDRELFKMALEALEAAYHPDTKAGEVMGAISARLAQPEPLAQFKFQEYGPPNWGDSQVTKPDPDIPIKVQDEREANYKSFAQSAQVLGAQYDPRHEPSGSWTSWDNTMCNPLAPARMQTQSAWADGYASAKKKWVGLTDEEINSLINTWVRELVFELEVMLRDKNT